MEKEHIITEIRQTPGKRGCNLFFGKPAVSDNINPEAELKSITERKPPPEQLRYARVTGHDKRSQSPGSTIKKPRRLPGPYFRITSENHGKRIYKLTMAAINQPMGFRIPAPWPRITKNPVNSNRTPKGDPSRSQERARGPVSGSSRMPDRGG